MGEIKFCQIRTARTISVNIKLFVSRRERKKSITIFNLHSLLLYLLFQGGSSQLSNVTEKINYFIFQLPSVMSHFTQF
jgi:hypothetical protein